MNTLPAELKMKVFNEMVSQPKFKLTIKYLNFEQVYEILSITSPFGKEEVIVKKSENHLNEKTDSILKVKNSYEFVKFLLLREKKEQKHFEAEIIMELGDEYWTELDDGTDYEEELEIVKSYLNSMF